MLHPALSTLYCIVVLFVLWTMFVVCDTIERDEAEEFHCINPFRPKTPAKKHLLKPKSFSVNNLLKPEDFQKNVTELSTPTKTFISQAL